MKTLVSLSLQSFARGGGAGAMCSSANVSHLTCSKAEQISRSLPLNVRLLPQGVRISLVTLSSAGLPPHTQRFPLQKRAKGRLPHRPARSSAGDRPRGHGQRFKHRHLSLGIQPKCARVVPTGRALSTTAICRGNTGPRAKMTPIDLS